MLYCALVQYMLEYRFVLWDPYTATDTSMLERVQRHFLSKAAFMLKIEHNPHAYLPVIEHLELISLTDRRGSIILEEDDRWTYKCLPLFSLVLHLEFLLFPQDHIIIFLSLQCTIIIMVVMI